ncbi:MAG: alpha/beta fold hydrolase, partial [Alphaproteobacteria bacterium]
MMAEIEPIVGRYVKLKIAGEDYRIYFEEAGEGIPLLCLHTAGAHASQFRHLMCDPEVSKNFRVIAFDLPWHGKSNPPVGWETKEY